MPKLTKTGEEIGSSNGPTIVLHKNRYGGTRQKELEKTKMALRGEDLPADTMNVEAKLRGNCLEAGVADFALALLQRMVSGSTSIEIWEPKDAFRHPQHRIASSIDRIIEIKGGGQ